MSILFCEQSQQCYLYNIVTFNNTLWVPLSIIYCWLHRGVPVTYGSLYWTVALSPCLQPHDNKCFLDISSWILILFLQQNIESDFIYEAFFTILGTIVILVCATNFFFFFSYCSCGMPNFTRYNINILFNINIHSLWSMCRFVKRETHNSKLSTLRCTCKRILARTWSNLQLNCQGNCYSRPHYYGTLLASGK